MNHKEINTNLRQYFRIIGTYYIADDWKVHVDGDVNVISEKINQDKLSELPIQFGTVSGCFDSYNTNIITLKGFPEIVKIDCFINNNTQLKSLEFAPKSERFSCHDCSGLESLDGLNCKYFLGNRLNLKRFGTNFTAEVFKFDNNSDYFLEATTEEFRHFFKLNAILKTYHTEKWIQLIKSYNEHKDVFRIAMEFEELYGETLVKSENRIEVTNSILTMDF